VAVTLYLRCKDIMAVERAKKGEVRCPFCYEGQMKENYLYVQRDAYGRTIDQLSCDQCAFIFSYQEYKLCYKRAQLNMGGAGESFKRYIGEYEKPEPPEKRMIQVDRLIHEFHYSLRSAPDQPTRSVGPNLLAANLHMVMRFLDELSGMAGENTALQATAEQWQVEKRKCNELWKWDV